MNNFDFITIKRFLNKIKLDHTNCWVWDAYKHPKGYGQMRVNGKTVWAYRLSYEIFKGDIPKGLTIDHLCRVRSCVNPDHLEAVTMKENILRGVGITAKESRQTHCKSGHRFILENTNFVKTKSGFGRECKICRQGYQRSHYNKKTKQTHCKRGHLRSNENLCFPKNRSPQCKN